MRLFQITDTTTRKPVPDLFFTDKPQAKAHRNLLNQQHGVKFRFFVSPGPDHRRHDPTANRH